MTAAGAPIDWPTYDALVKMTGDDPEFLDDLIDTYLADGVDQLAALDAANEAGDADALTRPAHSFKSSSLNVGALGLADVCRQLEEQGREARLDGAADRIGQAHRDFDAARQALLARRLERRPA